MHNAALPLPADRITPRKRVLLGLGAGVLLAHLGLLSGGVSGLSLDLFAAPDTEKSSSQPNTDTPLPANTADMTPNPDTQEPVRSSRVRWIVAKAPEPTPVPPPPPAAIKPPPPPPPPEPVVVEAPAPPPIEEPPPLPQTEVATVESPEPVVETPIAAPTPPVSDLPPGTETAAGTVQSAGLGAADASLPPAIAPPNAALRYEVTGSNKGITYSATGQLDWKNDGQQYEAKLVVQVFLLGNVLDWSSAGLVGDKGLVPDRFSTKGTRGERAAHFEREGQRIRYSNNAPDAKLLPGAQDRLSISMQLAGLFNARPDAYAQGQQLRLPVSSVDSAEIWLFEVGPLANELLPSGEAAARKLTRIPRKEFDQKLEVWLLPGYAHLPGHIRFTQPNGDIVDLKLKELPVLELGNATVQ
jgi:hypothetical protein